MNPSSRGSGQPGEVWGGRGWPGCFEDRAMFPTPAIKHFGIVESEGKITKFYTSAIIKAEMPKKTLL